MHVSLNVPNDDLPLLLAQLPLTDLSWYDMEGWRSVESPQIRGGEAELSPPETGRIKLLRQDFETDTRLDLIWLAE